MSDHPNHQLLMRPSPWVLNLVVWLNSLGSGILWTGVFFVTEKEFNFTEGENLLLSLGTSLIYIPSALGSGPLRRRWLANAAPRSVLRALVWFQGAASLLALAGAWGVVASAILVSAVAAAFWPIMESYVASGRHGHDMRRSLGNFNLAWMSAVGASLFLIAPIVGSSTPRLAILVLVPVSVLSLILLRWLPTHPAPHAAVEHSGHLPAVYGRLLRATRAILPICYLFIGALSPLLPFIMDRSGVEVSWQVVLVAVWMWARVGVVAGLSRLAFWHGRWSTLAIGVALLAGGFALILSSQGMAMMAAGFVCFGLGQGILYYASIYYAMAVGGAAIDAGGVFEGLIGFGYTLGPLAVFLGRAVGGEASVVACVWVFTGLMLIPAIRAAWPRRGVPTLTS